MTRFSWRKLLPVWLPGYRKQWLHPDIVAGITLWAVIVPEAMAYAGIAGVSPLMGLYTIPLPLFLYALLGTSRLLVVGPDSITALISASAVGAVAAKGTADFATMTVAMALLVGVLFLIFGVIRMGWVVNFISKPVMSGFLEGVVLITILGQIPKLLGIAGRGGNFFPDLWAIWQQLPQVHPATAVIGLTSLALLIVIERRLPRLPVFLLVLALAAAAGSIFHLPQQGVKVIGRVTDTAPAIRLSAISLNSYLSLLPGGLAIALLGYVETLGAAEGAAAAGDDDIDPDREFIALGAANLGSALSGGFVAVGSLSKTSVALAAKGKTQLGAVVSGVLAIFTIGVLMPLLANLPEAALAAVVIAAMLKLDQSARLKEQLAFSRVEFALALASFVGVLTLGVLSGVAFGVTLSLLALIWRAGHPGTAVLGKIPGETTYRDIKRRPEAQTIPGLLIFRFDADLIFPNSRYFIATVKRAIAHSPTPTQIVLINAETINDIDITGAETLVKLHKILVQQNIHLWLAQVKDPVMDKLRRMGIEDLIGASRCFESINDGVHTFIGKAS